MGWINWEIVLRLTLTFFTLLILARFMGRKEISQMTFFNFISAVAIGSIAASQAISTDISIANGMLALVAWSLFTILMGYVDIKSKLARKVLDGEPVIVIKNGKIMEKAMRKTRLDLDALKAMLRLKNVFSISDVEYAIFETNGSLSVMKKEQQLPVTKNDLGLQTPSQSLAIATEVVSDGSINYTNLSRLHVNEDWLKQELKKQGIMSVQDVFYAEVKQDGSLYINKREDIH
ncbi:DUF421 domain-containing protein [Paenibacillus turpanensis]|uniref:DUF421 domain-containing protein n=1 Tax=Paenibacillus turpanensis TaxID=2689078 RepID=UPI001407DDFF|nr:DUF421 domain-containing protein [Paenibacillus turpanensis]